MKEPSIGDDIYVPTSLYLGHGRDDFQGGLCRVKQTGTRISAGEPTLFVEVEERPGSWMNWPWLAGEQEKLREQFGDRRGYADPDNDPRFNEP